LLNRASGVRYGTGAGTGISSATKREFTKEGYQSKSDAKRAMK
jgi:hypothetical protein